MTTDGILNLTEFNKAIKFDKNKSKFVKVNRHDLDMIVNSNILDIEALSANESIIKKDTDDSLYLIEKTDKIDEYKLYKII